MERFRHQHGINIYDVSVRNINNNNMWVGKSRNPPPPSFYSNFETVTKSKRTWWWDDAEKKRKRRVAKYKFYSAEGKFKHSMKKGFRWLKIKCINIVPKF